MICKNLFMPPFQIIHLARQQTRYHLPLIRWCMRQDLVIACRLALKGLNICLIALGSGYSNCTLTSIGRNVSCTHLIMGESTQVSSGRSLNHCPDMLL
jgi:hypothetical protein